MVVPSLDNPMDLPSVQKKITTIVLFDYFENTFVRAWAACVHPQWAVFFVMLEPATDEERGPFRTEEVTQTCESVVIKKGAGACRACAWRARTANARAVKGRSDYAMPALAIQVTVLFVGVRSMFVLAKHSFL